MIDRYDDADVRRELERWIASYGVRGLARLWGVSPQLISDTRNGVYSVGPTLAQALGFREDGKRWVRSDN